MLALPYSLAYLLSLSVAYGLYAKGFFLLAPLLVAFIALPFLDLLLPPLRADKQKPAPHLFHNFFLWLAAPLEFLLLFWATKIFLSAETKPFEKILLVLVIGIQNGAIGITVAHELIHRAERAERAIGLFLLAQVNFMHYRVEHVFGHHKNVATPLDPATAPRGMSLYRFWPRAFWGGVNDAWNFEKKRSGFSGKNRMLHYIILQTGVALALLVFLGLPALLFFLGQSAVAILLLLTIDYVEHYGLERHETGNGRYSPAKAEHSWDSTHRMTNWMLFNLGLHAHHHLKPLDPYEKLRENSVSPRLPAGYASMLLLSLVPPLWKKVMDPRIPARPN